MQLSLSTRFNLVYVALAGVLAAVAYATVRGLQHHAPRPLAPQAVALVRRYLETLQAGKRGAACRIVALPSLCPTRTPLEVRRFTVAPAQPTVDGVEVPATIDDEDALFLLSPARRGVYRIVDVVAASMPVPGRPEPG